MPPTAGFLSHPLLTTHVKATTEINGSYTFLMAVNPNLSLVDGNANTTWYASSVTGQRLHFDFVAPVIVTRIYYENAHASGNETTGGLRGFSLWASDAASDFADMSYSSTGTWRQLQTSASEFDAHVASNVPDPKFIEVSNWAFAYRYWAVKVSGNWGGPYMGIRRIRLMGHSAPPPLPLSLRGPRMR